MRFGFVLALALELFSFFLLGGVLSPAFAQSRHDERGRHYTPPHHYQRVPYGHYYAPRWDYYRYPSRDWLGYPLGLYPFVPPPVIYRPPVFIVPAPQPQVYMERPQDQYWYRCENPDGYYPYVQECLGGWTRVIPTAPSRR